MNQELDLRSVARELFAAALRSVDAGQAVRQSVRLEGSRLTIRDTNIDLDAPSLAIYALAIGKASLPMAAALDEVLKERLTEGLVIGSPQRNPAAITFSTRQRFRSAWHLIEGGHPLPNNASLIAAQSAFALLKRANEESALVIFLISGGGSAMIEWPRNDLITLAELRDANRLLIACGASIAEINAVRRSFSATKGGGLAAYAPNSKQVTLIISDAAVGQEAIVASGPSCEPPHDGPKAADVITRYGLARDLPPSILNLINEAHLQSPLHGGNRLRDHYVLLDCGIAIEAATNEARRRGFAAEFTNDISEQPIAEGCDLMLSRLKGLRSGVKPANRLACLISGGEFSCPVKGAGIGGRNAETALRCALKIDEMRRRNGTADRLTRIAVLSAGTDGIDGNSPAAGAVATEDSVERAIILGMDPLDFLERSDAYGFFDALGDTIVTGPTGTNVRDLRITLLEYTDLFAL